MSQRNEQNEKPKKACNDSLPEIERKAPGAEEDEQIQDREINARNHETEESEEEPERMTQWELEESYGDFQRRLYKTAEFWDLEYTDARYCKNRQEALLYMLQSSLEQIVNELHYMNTRKE